MRTLLLPIVALMLAACSTGSGPTAAPVTPTPVTPTPVVPTPSGPATSPDPATYWLRMTTWQAIPPVDLFDDESVLAITGDGIAVVGAPVPAVYPGPLVVPQTGRPVSDAGRARILEAARELGLLNGQTDFMPTGDALVGAVSGRIELTVDGQRITLTGDPAAHVECVTTPCDAPPGTPAAFGELWRMLSDLPTMLGPELGPETPYEAPAFAILVGPPPAPDPMVTAAPVEWPLDESLATFGVPVQNGSYRCGTVSGDDADTIRPAVMGATLLTTWVDDPGSRATFGLGVRPMVPGEDACREVFGVG